MVRIYSGSKFSISKLDESIYFASFSRTESLTLEDVRLFNDSMDAVIQMEFHVSIIDISGVLKILAEARNYLVQSEREKIRNVVAIGLVTETALARTIGNFFVKVKPPKFPIKLFKDRDSAEEWVRERLQEYQQAQEEAESERKDQP